MKKKLLALVMVSVLTFAMGVQTFASSTVNLKVDGKVVSGITANVTNGRTMVEAKKLSQILGAQVDYNSATKMVSIETAANKIVFTIGSKAYTVNGLNKTASVEAEVENGRLVVPIKYITDALGAKITMVGNNVSITYFSNMSGTVKISGSTTVQPIAQAAADLLVKLNKGLSLTVAGGGSGAGIKDAIAGTSNIGTSSRELTSDEMKTLKVFTIANDGIAIIVHPSNPVKSLTKEQANKIFLGQIKNWNEVGGNNAPILVQTRETGSGTRATFEELLLAKTSVVASAKPHTSSALIKNAVAAEKNAIGYDSVGFLDSKVKAVALGGVQATTTTIKNKTYPLSRQLFVVTKGAPKGVAAMYIDYLRTLECQNNIVAKEGYISLY